MRLVREERDECLDLRVAATQAGVVAGDIETESAAMINGAHFLLYSKDADADRRFLRDVLGLRGVDAGGGWLIFALPPAEIAVHPAEENFAQRHGGHVVLGAVLYLMCDDLHETMASLAAKEVATTEVETAPWGVRTTLRLPSGGELGLYQPTHPSPLER